MNVFTQTRPATRSWPLPSPATDGSARAGAGGDMKHLTSTAYYLTGAACIAVACVLLYDSIGRGLLAYGIALVVLAAVNGIPKGS